MSSTSTMSNTSSVSTSATSTERPVDVQDFPSLQPRPATNPATVLWLRLEGQLGAANRQQLKQRIVDELHERRRCFVLDFSMCGYVDGTGLGVLVSIGKQVREAGGRLVLAGLNSDLRTLFDITKLATLFTIADGALAALSHFAGVVDLVNAVQPVPPNDAAGEGAAT